jgi:hypothetical protein
MGIRVARQTLSSGRFAQDLNQRSTGPTQAARLADSWLWQDATNLHHAKAISAQTSGYFPLRKS